MKVTFILDRLATEIRTQTNSLEENYAFHYIITRNLELSVEFESTMGKLIPTDLQSVPFDHFGTIAYIHYITYYSIVNASDGICIIIIAFRNHPRDQNQCPQRFGRSSDKYGDNDRYRTSNTN